MDVVAAGRSWGSFEGGRDAFAVNRDLQNAGRVGRRVGKFAGLPFFSVKDERRRIDALLFPAYGIIRLALGPDFRRERIAPAEVVPVIDVERDRDDVLPESRRVLE